VRQLTSLVKNSESNKLVFIKLKKPCHFGGAFLLEGFEQQFEQEQEL
jgi:hypothetical protein